MITVYENSPENREKIGWALVPDRCIGDTTFPYVVHDPAKGTFTFAQDVDCPRCPVKMTKSGHLCEDCGLNI